MLKSWILVMIMCAVALSTFSQTPAKYEVATILDIKPHEPAGDNSSPAGARYDVSLKVADTIYLVLYTDTLGANTVKYAAGREGLVHVGKKTILFNDMLGRSQEVPIIGQKPATTVSQGK